MTTLFLMLLLPLGVGASQNMLHDIVFSSDQTIELRNEFIQVEFDPKTGAWQSLSFKDAGNCIAPGSSAFDILINNQPYLKNKCIQFLGHTTRVDPHRNGVVLDMMYRVDDLEITSSFRLFPHVARLERSIAVSNFSDHEIKLWGFVFELPNVVLADPERCILNIPGPWFPKSYIGADKPYAEMTKTNITCHGAPEAGFGFVGLTNTELDLTLATWMVTHGEVNYNPIIRGDGERLTLAMQNNRQYRLLPGMSVTSDPQVVEFTKGDVTDATNSYREMIEKTLPLGGAPDWVRESVILEVYPPYFKNGFVDITKKLPHYKDIGFNCIYVMPHWLGGYSPIDLYTVNPQYGTQEELQELVKTAHDLGLKVLFDMVIHGMNEKSPLMEERPDLFCKNEHGEIVRHPTWRSKTFDWANPVYQHYMVELVTHDIQTYNIDGYRVDAASYKGPNWDPTIPYPAYRSGAAAPELMSKMLNALRDINPDAVLLSEVFGPAFHNVCNFVHDNQTEACQMLIEKIESGEASAETYKAHLTNVFSLLPDGANRVIYTRNHDTSWFYHFNGYTPRFLAFEAINALCAIPEIFAGDPNNGPNPDDDPETWAYYKKMFALRASLPELTFGVLDPKAVTCSNPMVFSAIKKLAGKRCLILVSLLETKADVSFRIDGFTSVTLIDLDGTKIKLNEPKLTMQPFQVLVGRLE